MRTFSDSSRYHRVVGITLLVVAIGSVVVACAKDDEEEPAYTQEDVEEMRRGYRVTDKSVYSFRDQGGVWKTTARAIEEDLRSQRPSEYEEGPRQWYFDVAMANLIAMEFVEAFRAFEAYLERDGSRARVYHRVAMLLWHVDARFEARTVSTEALHQNEIVDYELSSWEIVELFEAMESLRVHVSLLFALPQRQRPKALREHELYSDALKTKRNIEAKYDQDSFISRNLTPRAVPPEAAVELYERREALSQPERNYLLNYFVDPLRRDTERAETLADMNTRDIEFSVGGSTKTHSVVLLVNMVDAYLYAGRYADALDVYTRNREHRPPSGMADSELYVRGSAAAAGTGRTEEGIQLLERQVSRSILTDYLAARDVESGLPGARRPSLLHSMFMFYLHYDGFRALRDGDSGERLDELFRDRIEDFSELEIFS